MKNKGIILFSLLIIPFMVNSQDYKIILQKQNEDGLYIQWIPLNDSIWQDARLFTFKIRRTSLSNNRVETIVENIKPREFSWFWERRTIKNGLPLLVGRTLYDTYSNNSQENIEKNTINYNYLFEEALNDSEIAIAIGYGFLDKNITNQQQYKYEVILAKPGKDEIVGSIDVLFNDSVYLEKPENIILEFNHPAGQSLSALSDNFAGTQVVKGIARSYGDSIVLRWAPNSPDFLSKSNDSGYVIYRIDNELLRNTLIQNFIPIDTIRPWSKERFASSDLRKDSMLNIAAQLLYDQSEYKDSVELFTRYQAIQMRYMGALIAAERSSTAASALGLRYTDKKVEKDKNYIYIIHSLGASNSIADAWLEVENLAERKATIVGAKTDSLDHAVLLKWSRSNSEFSVFRIERSSDGGNSFELLTKTPLMFLESSIIEDQGEYFTYVDSLKENYKTYIYRIQGLDAFSEWSEPAEVIGMGVDLTPPDIPAISFLEVKDGGADIRWIINPDDREIKYYHLWKANSLIEEFTLIVPKIPANISSYFYPGPISTDSAYYFALQAEDIHGNISAFSPYTLPVVDSIPPGIPKNISSSVDSSGIVTLTWDSGTESDLTGYRVYVSNNPNHEFAELTVEPTTVNNWSDTINLDLLDKEIYYKIAAEDKNYNLSPFSDIIIVKRPDIIPPAAPASLPPSYSSKGIILNWISSSSDDLIGYIIYRKVYESDLALIELVKYVDPLAVTYTDTSARMDVLYEYSILAEDESGLRSELSFPILARRPFDRDLLKIENFSVRRDPASGQLEMSWSFNAPPEILNSDNYNFNIYESSDSAEWRKIKQVASDTNQFTYKKEFKPEDKIYFAIKAVLANGKTSALVISNL